ncbi:hypothetical protein TGGT1_310235 [Toxoplasma gondii GT1]|uniref:Transmembrane protein n=1 Tax=Toxoplasma gondii (strain ATCC 50853 / GT1) TaxID=507601 RepID=S7W7W3_TOXGG|nr:hypothetical protein TGGT1_310235 [Toxoplasma gondii GT1]
MLSLFAQRRRHSSCASSGMRMSCDFSFVCNKMFSLTAPFAFSNFFLFHTQQQSRGRTIPARPSRTRYDAALLFLAYLILNSTVFDSREAGNEQDATCRLTLPVLAVTAKSLPPAAFAERSAAASASQSALFSNDFNVEHGGQNSLSDLFLQGEVRDGDRFVQRHERFFAAHRPDEATAVLTPVESRNAVNEERSGRPSARVRLLSMQREKGEKLKLNAAQQLRAAAVVEAVFAQLAQFHPDAYESANVRGLIKWWDDPYIIILLCLMFGGLVSMGIWCLVASYR